MMEGNQGLRQRQQPSPPVQDPPRWRGKGSDLLSLCTRSKTEGWALLHQAVLWIVSIFFFFLSVVKVKDSLLHIHYVYTLSGQIKKVATWI